MQTQSIAHVPTWMRFYERAQALGAFEEVGKLDPASAIREPQALTLLKNLFDLNAIAAPQTRAAADI